MLEYIIFGSDFICGESFEPTRNSYCHTNCLLVRGHHLLNSVLANPRPLHLNRYIVRRMSCLEDSVVLDKFLERHRLVVVDFH